MNTNNLTIEDSRKLKKWCWGAFGLHWIWGVCHNVLISLICLAFAPFSIYLGIKGYELAWEKGNYNSVDEMIESMKIWNIFGLILFILSVVGVVVQVIGAIVMFIRL